MRLQEIVQGEKTEGLRERCWKEKPLCDPYYARLARSDNDANVIAIGARVVAPQFAMVILDVWIGTSFEGGRHKRRIGLIAEYERSSP